MNRRALLVAVVLGVLLLGSAAAFADGMMTSDPQVGISKDQLVQQLGQPLSSASDGNGGTILVYEDSVAVGAESNPENLAVDQYYIDASGKVYQHRHSIL